MALTFGFFADAAATTPVVSLYFSQADSAPVAQDRIVYFASANAARRCQADSDPGIDPILVSIADAAPVTGSPASDIKLALSSGGLASAVAGAALALPATINGGFANAIPIHVRVLDSTGVVGVKTDLRLTTNPLRESAL